MQWGMRGASDPYREDAGVGFSESDVDCAVEGAQTRQWAYSEEREGRAYPVSVATSISVCALNSVEP